MSLLQDYVVVKNEVEDRMEGELALKYLLEYQELAYRICVLETLKVFTDSVPDIGDEKGVRYHCKATAAFLRELPAEHKFAPKTNEEGAKKRETALKSLQKVCDDAEEKFSKYKPQTQEAYKKDIAKMIKPVTTVWAQYRNTLVPIGGAEKSEKVEEPEKSEPKKTEGEEVKAAMQVSCPLKKFAGLTLGEVLKEDPRAINFLANEYSGKEEVRAAAKTLCEYAKRQSA